MKKRGIKMEIMPFIKNFSFKKNKNSILIILLIGVLMLVCSKSLFSENRPKESAKEEKSAAEKSENDERKLSEMLGKIYGAGKTEVMITYDSTPEKVTVSDSKTSKSVSDGEKSENSGERTTVMQKDGNTSAPFVKTEVNPKVRGVLVIADGADNAAVSANLKKAVCAVLDVPVHKVEVMPRKK